MKTPAPLIATLLGVAASSVLIASCATTAMQPVEVRPLRVNQITEPDQAPDEKVQLGKRPGSGQPLARSFEQQPPLIPHATANFDEITLEENQCLSCHGPDTYQKKKAPKIGDSHFRDRDNNLLKNVSMARHNCVQCHVPQFDAKPLVDNTFQSVGRN
jgi:cytochrome c-type protein NapB